MLHQLGASVREKELATEFFDSKKVSQAALKDFLNDLRTRKSIQ